VFRMSGARFVFLYDRVDDLRSMLGGMRTTDRDSNTNPDRDSASNTNAERSRLRGKLFLALRRLSRRLLRPRVADPGETLLLPNRAGLDSLWIDRPPLPVRGIPDRFRMASRDR